MKYGRLPRLYKPTVSYGAVVAGTTLPPPPASADYLSAMPDDLGMLGNDTIGDCTCAAVAHARQVWSFHALESMRETATSDVIDMYSAVTGYNPAQPQTDQGAAEQDVLNFWMHHGAPIGNGAVNKLSAWLEIDPRLINDVKRAIWEAGLVYIGFNVPAYLENLESPLSVWDLQPDGDQTIVGGHAVILPAYDPAGFGVISWGAKYVMTPAFFSTFVDEVYMLADKAFINYHGTTPAGLSLQQLEALMLP